MMSKSVYKIVYKKCCICGYDYKTDVTSTSEFEYINMCKTCEDRETEKYEKKKKNIY
jgi:hypothetical protein